MEGNNKSGQGNLILGIVLVTISLFVLVYANINFPDFRVGGQKLPGPKFFPSLLSVFLIISGIYEIILALLKKPLFKNRKIPITELIKDWGFQNFFILVLSIILYVPCIKLLGFFIGTTLIAVVLLYRLEVSPGKSFFVAISLSLIIMLLFEKLFKIQLPDGFFNITF